ncbi:hypothetical protein V5799_033213 [Amblyomma americanum]|uniref:Uncharacterized protein n=1 Tax=Amblyomma americanum TaxID=6943 RepID=A0AAQ4DNY7_AMBAM
MQMKKDDYEKNLYHDEQRLASVLVDIENGVKVEGVLSDTLRIKPLARMSRSDDRRIPHALYEIELPPTAKEKSRQCRTRYHAADENSSSHQNFSVESREAQQASDNGSLPKVIFPEIYIVVDTMFASVFWWDELAITSYLAVFLNAVNLRFKTLRHPKIKLRLVGITVSTENEPYLAKLTSGHILDAKTLENFKTYYKGRIEYQNSDLLYLLTGRDMAFYNGDVLETWVGGTLVFL